MPERFRGTRWDPGRRGVLVLLAVGVAAVVFAAAAAQRERPAVHAVPPLSAARSVETTALSPSATTAEPIPPAPPADLVVSIVGLVERPGLLHLPPGSRVADAVSLAVAREGADLATLNLAQRLTDGDQVIVGAHTPTPGPPQLGSAIIPAGQLTPATRTSPTPQPKINLNTATESDLDTLPGIGPTMARAILTWRADHGHFTTLDQLSEIPGIGPTRAARLRPLVTL
ncbi:helix-hairpin-helix domain-containing protein [Nocardia pseudobrasiliensis]|uniref:helix-hairpin-helix domain-containing protein n=1 Tax=Nocardia pseudobrasiliensis TaxID=45979 RepID=UPI001C3FEA71|nr:helix-hairpin-helix domain-containing protein [Nocardia pseudobrasiliensis]